MDIWTRVKGFENVSNVSGVPRFRKCVKVLVSSVAVYGNLFGWSRLDPVFFGLLELFIFLIFLIFPFSIFRLMFFSFIFHSTRLLPEEPVVRHFAIFRKLYTCSKSWHVWSDWKIETFETFEDSHAHEFGNSKGAKVCHGFESVPRSRKRAKWSGPPPHILWCLLFYGSRFLLLWKPFCV